MNIYSIKNEKLSFFNRPMYCESFNECLTLIQNILMSDADRALLGLKEDLALYQLGSVDFVNGKIDGFRVPKKIFDLKEIFDSIPEDKVPQTAKRLWEELESLRKQISDLKGAEAIENVD